MSKEFFISGFLKQAEIYGLTDAQNFDIFKKYAAAQYEELLTKTASTSLSPEAQAVLDSAVKSLPFIAGTNLIGAGLGSTYAPISDRELREELEYSENPSVSKYLKYLIPGYTGYRLAKENRIDHAYKKYLDTHNNA